LTRLPADGKLKREFLKKAGEACMKIASEWREEKGPKAAARAQSVAEQIKGML